MELPTDIYQVYPARGNGANYYTSEKSVKYALHYRIRRGRADQIKVYQVVGVSQLGGLIWRDVTGRFLSELA